MKVQHLVLEDEVHRALRAHKRRTGATLREIGNAALRAALALPTPEKLVAKKLSSVGKVSPQDYARAAAEAERELKAILARLARDASPPPGKTRQVGSWKGRLLCAGSDGAYQVFLWWARDGKKIASLPHHHERSHEWRYVLRGRVAGRIGEKAVVLGAHESASIPPGVSHLSVPLTRDTAMIVVLAPPEGPPAEKAQRKPPQRAQKGVKSPRRGRTTPNRSGR